MNKKLIIIIGILVALLTGIVFLQVWGIKNKQGAADDAAMEAAQQAPMETNGTIPAKDEKSGAVSNDEINSLEADLNSVNDEDLGESGISDTEVGL